MKRQVWSDSGFGIRKSDRIVMVSLNLQTMPGEKVKTMSYKTRPAGIVAFYDSANFCFQGTGV